MELRRASLGHAIPTRGLLDSSQREPSDMARPSGTPTRRSGAVVTGELPPASATYNHRRRLPTPRSPRPYSRRRSGKSKHYRYDYTGRVARVSCVVILAAADSEDGCRYYQSGRDENTNESAHMDLVFQPASRARGLWCAQRSPSLSPRVGDPEQPHARRPRYRTTPKPLPTGVGKKHLVAWMAGRRLRSGLFAANKTHGASQRS